MSLLRTIAATGLLLAAATPALAADFVGLTADGKLVPFESAKRAAGKAVAIKGVEGKILGIDVRPIDGKLYGVTDSGKIFTIDPTTGAATVVSQLNKAFEPGGRAVVDFNPQADRLRLLGENGTSFRVNVATGEVAVDGTLRYADNDANKMKKPVVTAAAYTNPMANAKGTELIDLDTTQKVLALQSPPNDGVLQTRGKYKASFDKTAAFDIELNKNQDNIGHVVAARTLYTIDLDNGATKKLGAVSKLPAVIDIAVLPAK